MLSESRVGGQAGSGMGKIFLVPPGERFTNHIQAPSVVPAKSVSFSSSALANFYSGLRWRFPQEEHASCKWPVLAALPGTSSPENSCTGLGCRSQSLVSSWSDCCVEFLNNTRDQNLCDDDSTKQHLTLGLCL